MVDKTTISHVKINNNKPVALSGTKKTLKVMRQGLLEQTFIL